jgi:pimeloyl-ACP methyl ester carboxylesterase
VPTIALEGAELWYELHGSGGDPLVLVHGYTGDVSDWHHQIREFGRTHRVLALDHRGHGHSHAPRDRASYTIERLAADVEAIAAEAGFERWHLVGHSMGGAVAQEIALRGPERLASLTLEDTSHAFDFGGNEAVARIFESRLRLAEEKGMTAVAELPRPPLPPHMPAARAEEEKRRLARMSVDGFIGGWHALSTWAGTRERAAGIRVPTLVIHGELDAALLKGSRWLAETIPGAVLAEIPEAGHSPQYERPDLFNAHLRRHLERHAIRAARA